MKVLIQKVSTAQVVVNDLCVGQINLGFLLFVCFEKEDREDKLIAAVDKITNLRIFPDENGKMNLNLKDAGGEILSISQFTLSWDGQKGNRPSFDKSLPPEHAKVFYHLFNERLKACGFKVEMGRFGADMKVTSTNDGPVTFMLNF